MGGEEVRKERVVKGGGHTVRVRWWRWFWVVVVSGGLSYAE